MSTLNEYLEKALKNYHPKENLDEGIVDEYLSILDKLDSIHQKIDEKWDKKVDIKSTGEHAEKTVAQLKKEIEALKGKAGNKEKMGELLFAIRSKEGWPKGKGSTGV